MKLESGLFAEVPHELVKARHLKPSVKVIFIHCLVRYQAKKDDGEPWTFSVASIAAETGLSQKTVRRHVGPLRKKGVLKLYGTMSENGRDFDVFTFSPEGLVALIHTTARTSGVVLRAANGDGTTLETATDKLADNLSDKMPPRREDGRKEEDRREEKIEKDLVACSSGPFPTAAGGFPVGIPSTSVASPPFDATTIQNACGSPNAGGQNKPDTFLPPVSVPVIHRSASGDANIGARKNTTGHSKKSAPRANGTTGIGLTDAELDELAQTTGCTKDQLKRFENDYLMRECFGVRRNKPRNGFDSL